MTIFVTFLAGFAISNAAVMMFAKRMIIREDEPDW